MSETQIRGAEGEEAAVRWLRAHGFLIVDRNWRMGRYELDIVATRHDRLHIVEVKLRGAGGLTTPEEALTPAKQRALLRAANLYVETMGIRLDCQIDLVAVDRLPDGTLAVRYIPDAVPNRW